MKYAYMQVLICTFQSTVFPKVSPQDLSLHYPTFSITESLKPEG